MIKPFFTYILFLSLLFGQTELNNKFNLAREFESKQDLEKASMIYLELYEQNKNNPQFFDALFRINERMKNYEFCLGLLNEKLTGHPNDINSIGKIGSVYIKMGAREKAFEIWENSLSIKSPNALNYRIIADYMIQNRAYDEAIEVLKSGREQGGPDDMFSRDIAHLYSVTMRYNESAEEYCNFLIKAPNQLHFVNSRVQSYLKNELVGEQFLTTIRDFYEENKTVPIAQFLVHVLKYLGKYNEALEYIDDLDQKTNSNGEKFLQFAQQAFTAKSFHVAAKAYKYIIDEINNLNLLPASHLGYVRSQESAMQKLHSKKSDWQYSSIVDTSGFAQAEKLIKDYLHVESLFKRADISNEIFYHVGILYSDKLKKNELALKYFNASIKKIKNSKFSVLSNEKIGHILLRNGKLEKAKDVFTALVNSPQNRGETTSRQKLALGKIHFWESNFSKSLKLLNEVTDNRSDDIANDAIELILLLTAGQKDSVNLAKLATAGYDFVKREFESASNLYKELFETENVFLLNSYAGIRYSESLLMMNDTLKAIETLTNISDNSEGLFADKALFLLGQTYQFSLLDFDSSAKAYEKLLDKYPASIYLDRARESLLYITSKESNNS